MKNNTYKSFYLILLLCILTGVSANAQEAEPDQNDTTNKRAVFIAGRGFHLGLYVGAYWANKSTAYIYDGYGFDQNGQRNTFENSILYNQIVNVYGGKGGNGYPIGPDLIAQLLNVNSSDWFFTQQDMPTNLKYTTTYMVGLNMRYQVNKKSNITLNINGSKLIVNGKFTVNTTTPSNGFQSLAKVNQFTITGAEQRLMFQLGYQSIIGKNEKINLVVEGGLNFTLSKAQKNQAFLNSDEYGGANNFTIDLMSVYNQPPYNFYSAKYLIGAGIGAVGGLGVQFTINPRYSVQLLYIPSYDRIGLGYTPAFKLQNGFGLRVYYNMS